MRIQHYNDYGKIVREEGFDNYLHDQGPLFHDTVTNTTSYLYSHDTLLVRKTSAFKAKIDSSLIKCDYDSTGRLIWDYEVRVYRNTHLIIGDSATTDVDTFIHFYHYGNNGKLSFEEMPDRSPIPVRVYYEYDLNNNLIAVKEWTNDSILSALTYYEYDQHNNLITTRQSVDGFSRINGKSANVFYLSRIERTSYSDGQRCVTLNYFNGDEDDKNQTWFYSCLGSATAVETEISQVGHTDGRWDNYEIFRKYYTLNHTKRLIKEERSNFYGYAATIIYEYR